MCQDDLEAVISIEMYSFTTPWSQTVFYEEMSNPLSILKVAESNGNVVGYICASHIMGEGHILDLAVSILYRRMGIATILIENIIAVLKEYSCSKVCLEVRAGNRAAIEMYRKLEFVESSRSKGYYRQPREDAVIMLRDL
ncbi:acetyltransferase YpeA [bacterium BMS3Abin07]|nr:acetyltransferase YpeA [bacterium BMS3Abin07]GBE33295.1 acetyltransferase YpeA [bacterium BMS3Bbin05]HDO21642.1 ribosomal-protein-alanine N-acetyltransferase [Nitrospirota bacterium]